MDGTVYARVRCASAACRVRAQRGQAPDLVGDGGTFADARGSRQEENGIYLALFVLSLLSVARVLPWELMLAVVLIVLIFTDRAVFLRVDYCLLFTFISFFIFIGNMGNIEAVRSVLQSLVAGRELAVGIGASQIISNVPATLLLADFTQDIKISRSA